MRVLVPARRSESEWMDREGNDPEATAATLRDIRKVNRLLGGERALLSALDPLLESAPAASTVRILDVGTGLGDLPVAMIRRGERHAREVSVTAVDIDPAAAEAAARFTRHESAVRVVRADAFHLPFDDASFDVVTCSMFLHHFRHEEAVRLLASFRRLARRAVLVNDLRRHVLPWLSITLLARMTGRHPMFVHDAPLSVLRGFTEAEILRAATDAGAAGAVVRRRFPFRLVVTLSGAAA